MSASRLRQQHGFTLIETLVAMVAGVVVTGAMLEILVVSLHQTSRLTDSVQATQLGRTAMTHIVDELHSACIAREFTPVQTSSNGSELIFINAYSKEAMIPNAYEHQIVWNATAGTLTDFIYESKVETGSEWPNFKFPAVDYSTTTHEAKNANPAKGVLLASHVSETEAAGKKVPIFRYYEYETKADTAKELEGTSLTTLSQIKATNETLGTTEAAKASAVLVSFATAPTDGETALWRSAELSDQVTFSFSTPSSETTIKDGPCE